MNRPILSSTGGRWLAAVLFMLLGATPARAGLNQWTSNGPEGGPILSLAIDSQISTTLFAGTSGGVFRSPNAGASWTAVNTGLTNRVVSVLAADPHVSGTLYAGTPAGVFKTTNAGGTWTAALGLGPLPILSLAIDPTASATIYAGTSAAVFKSTDGGSVWNAANGGLPALPIQALAIDPRAPATVYAGTLGGGAFKSLNGGASWSQILGLPPAAMSVFALAVHPVTVYAGTSAGIFRTGFNGAWLATELTNVTVNEVVIDPSAAATFYAGTAGGGIFKSDGGLSWTPANSGLTDLTVAALAIDPRAPATLYGGTRTGVFKTTTAAQSWAPVNGGLVLSQVTAVAIDPQTPATLYAGTQGSGVFKSADGGGSWAASSIGLANLLVSALAIGAGAPATIYAGTNGGGVFKSANGGASWAPASTGLTNSTVNALAVDPTASTVLYAGTNGGVFKSTDSGANWTPATTGITPGLQIRGLAVDPKAPGTLYASTGGGVFKSTTGGTSWSAMNNGLAELSVRTVAIDPQTTATLYAGTTGGVFQSPDGGGSWAPTGAGISETSIRVVLVDPQAPATVYTATSGGGVFRSTDRGASWSTFNVGLGNRDVRALALSPSSVCLHAGTFGGGVFDFATRFDDPCGALSPPVAAAVLPSSRSVAVGTPATAFATIINPNDATARSCGITLLTNDEATLSYQTTDPITNQVVGTPDTPVDIPPQGSQTYVIAVTATDNFNDVDMQFGFNCVAVAPAQIITGLNTLLLSAFDGPARPDIVALAASEGGIVNVSGPSLAGAFAVATINLGGDGTITASADTGGVSLPVVPFICETDPVTSFCKDPPAPTVRRGIGPGQTPTYGIFVFGTGGAVPFDPAVNRIFVRFKQIGTASSVTRGSTSVAVRTQ